MFSDSLLGCLSTVIARKGKGLPVSSPPKGKKKRDWKLTYRSNLKGIIDLMKEINLTDKHIEALKRTPFWLLLDAIRRKKLDYTTCQKKDDFIERFIGMYRGKHCFQVGNTKRRLTKDDVKVILGIQCGERDMELVHGSKREVDLVQRGKLKAGKVATSDIKTLVKSLVRKNNKTKQDIEDVAKLLCMFLCVTFLFSTSGNTLSWAHIQYLDDLNEMKEYDWAYEVLESLIQSIEKHRRTPRKVTGCVNLLLVSKNKHSFHL